MKCEYCSVEVSDIELEQHNESVTHQHNEYKLLEKAVEMNVALCISKKICKNII